MTVSINISKVLMDITGEPRTDEAVLEVLKDAIEYRIEKINTELQGLEAKYGMEFEMFKDKFVKGEIKDRFSYDIEMDYLEWEGFLSRLKKYNNALKNL